MDLTRGLAKELEEKAEENEDDPRALLEILHDLTTWSDDEIAELQRQIIDQVFSHIGGDMPKPPGPNPPSSGEEDGLDPDEWPDVGLLKKLGYTTGKNGQTKYRRRAILHQSLQADAQEWLPVEEQAEEWGQPESEKRLEKVANSLSAFAGIEKKKEKPAEVAISHWEADLKYLKERFYKPSYPFDWPSTDAASAGGNSDGKHPRLPFGKE